MMPIFKSLARKSSELEPGEMAGLRAVSKKHAVEMPMLRRLEKLGLVEETSGDWATTDQGHICLMFSRAR